MSVKNPRLRLRLDESTDKALITHLESCRTSQRRRADMHLFILAALDGKEELSIGLDMLTESEDQAYIVEFLIPPSSPHRVREIYMQTSRNLRQVVIRALVRYGFDLMQKKSGPSLTSILSRLDSTPALSEQVEDVDKQASLEVAEPQEADDEPDTIRPETGAISHNGVDKPSIPKQPERQRELEELDALDRLEEQESVPMSTQPQFDMERLLGSIE